MTRFEYGWGWFRYRGACRRQLHGLGEVLARGENPVSCELEFWGAVVEGRLQLRGAPFRTGVRYSYGNVELSFEGAIPESLDIPESATTTRIAGPSMSLRFDTRNPLVTPTSGFLSESTLSSYDESWGGTVDSRWIDQVRIGHLPLGPTLYGGSGSTADSTSGMLPSTVGPISTSAAPPPCGTWASPRPRGSSNCAGRSGDARAWSHAGEPGSPTAPRNGRSMSSSGAPG